VCRVRGSHGDGMGSRSGLCKKQAAWGGSGTVDIFMGCTRVDKYGQVAQRIKDVSCNSARPGVEGREHNMATLE